MQPAEDIVYLRSKRHDEMHLRAGSPQSSRDRINKHTYNLAAQAYTLEEEVLFRVLIPTPVYMMCDI